MAEKQNDMLSLKIFNPDASMSELNLAGISADNTSLKSELDYAKMESVLSLPQFLDLTGNFDKEKFHKFYQDTLKNYNMLAATANNQTFYSKYNIFAPVEQRDWNPLFEIKRFVNPFEQTKGLAGIGELGDKKRSIEEIAQTRPVYDPATDSYQAAPNDDFFGNFQTRFLAQYDEDTDEKDPITGEMVHHVAGEFKLDKDGKPYYENANGRSIAGKTVLHLSDVFTTDGSAINSIDFLDSDDMQKSAMGTLAKNVALVGSMFLPVVGEYVAGLVILQNAMQLGSVLGKIVVGSDTPFLNKLEGFAHLTNLQESKSEYAKNPDNMWCMENLINMVGDTVGQLTTQRAIFKYAPAIFKGKYGAIDKGDELLKAKEFERLSKYNAAKLKNTSVFDPDYALIKAELDSGNSLKATAMVEKYMKDYYKIGGVISKAYMTGITVQDMFQEAKDSGATDEVATGLTIGYAAAEYALLSTGLGEWILPELRLARGENKQLLKTILSPSRKAFKDGVAALNKEAAEAVTRTEKHGLINKAIRLGRKIANADYSLLNKSAGSIAAAALGEGTEEVSEEALADAFRAIHDTVDWLRGDDKSMFSSERMFDRYLMNFAGGFIGGGISGLGFKGSPSAYKQFKDLENMTSEQAMQRIVYKLRNEKNAGKDLRKLIEKMDWGDKNLSAFEFTEDENKNITFAEAKRYEDSQDYALKQAATKQLDLIEATLQTIENEGGAAVSDRSILDNNTLKDMRLAMFLNSTAAGQLIEAFNREVVNMVQAQTNIASMNSIQGRTEDNVPDQLSRTPEQSQHDELLKSEQEKYETAKQNAIDIATGRKATSFMTRAILELNPAIAKSFMIATFDQFVQQSLHKSVSDLTEQERQVQYNKYIEYCKTVKKDNLEFAENGYLNMVKLVKENFIPGLEKAYEGFTKLNAFDIALTQFYNELKEFRLKTLSPVQEVRRSPDEYINAAESTQPGSLKALDDGETRATFRLSGLDTLAVALASENDLLAIDYINARKEIKPEDPEYQSKMLGILFPFAVHGLEVVSEQYKTQGWMNSATKSYLTKLSDLLYDELSKISDVFASLDSIDELSQEDIQEFKTRAKYLVLDEEISGVIDSFDFKAYAFGDMLQEVNLQKIEEKFSEILQKLFGIKASILDMPNGPTMDLLDNFITDLGGVHVPLSTLLSNASALLESKRSLSQFSELDLGVESSLKQALIATELMQAYLEGARTSNAGFTRSANMLAGTALGGVESSGSTEKLNFNTTGINKMLNDIHKTIQERKAKSKGNKENQVEEEWEDLPLIDGIVADSIIQDLTLINRRIQFILDLLEINRGQKLNEQIRINANTAYLRYKAILKLVDIVPPDWNKTALEQVIANHSQKIEEFLEKDDKLTLSDDEQFELDRDIMAFEDAVYDFFQDEDNSKKDLKELLKGFDVYTKSTGLLNEQTEIWDDVTVWDYITNLRALKSSEVYRTQYETLGEGGIVPLDTQFLLTKLNLANTLNGDSVSEMQEALHDFIIDDLKNSSYDQRVQKLSKVFSESTAKKFAEDILLPYVVENLDFLPKFTNITFGEGLPGAGKTAGSSKTFVQILDTSETTKPLLKNVAVISTTPKIAETLGQNLDLENASAYDRVNFLKHILRSSSGEEWQPPTEVNGISLFKEGVDYRIEEVNGNYKLVHNYQIRNVDDVPSLIIIDEVSRFSDFEMQAIDQFAREHGISVITYGDFDQTQTRGPVKMNVPGLKDALGSKYPEIKQDQITFDARLDRNNFIHGPKLGSTLRTANSCKTYNTTVMQRVVQNPQGQISLRYYQGPVPGRQGTIIAGDKVYNVRTALDRDENPTKWRYDSITLNKILADIDVMLSSLKEGEQIGYIYSDKQSGLYKALFEDDGTTLKSKYKDKIKPYFGTTAQSQEGQYFIVETDVRKIKEKEAYVLDLYTGITRSQEGSIIIVPVQGIGRNADLTFLENVDNPTSVYSEEGISPESKVRYNERKRQIMKKLFDGIELSPLVYTERKKNNEATPSPTPGPTPGPTPSPTPGPTGGTPSVDIKQLELESGDLSNVLNQTHTDDGQEVIYGDGSDVTLLPIINENWLNAVGLPSEFKYLSRIDVSDTGIVGTITVLDEHGNSKQVDINDFDLEHFTKGGVKPLPLPPSNPDLNDGENDDAEDDGMEDTPSTNLNPDPELLDDESRKSRKRKVRLAEIDKEEKRLRPAERNDEIRKSFAMAQLLFSFNNFEDYGFKIDRDGKLIEKLGLDAEIAKDRIDGINGLKRIVQAYDDSVFDGQTADQAFTILSAIASSAKHSKSLSEIEGQIKLSVFGDENAEHTVACHFALKSNPTINNGKEYFNESGKYASFEKAAYEGTAHNESSQFEEGFADRKQIVLGIQIDGKPLLEVPIVKLNSPLSILQMKSGETNDFLELLDVWTPKEGDDGFTIIAGINKILDKFDDEKVYPQYRTLMNLFRLYLFTSPGYFIINKKFLTNGETFDLRNWTIGKDLINLGTEIDIEKGINSIRSDQKYSRKWVSIEDVASDPRKKVSSIYLLKEGAYGIKPGNSFVLVTDDLQLSESEMWKEYVKDQDPSNPNKSNKVSFYYVLPPKRSFGLYMISLRGFCTIGDDTKLIGNNMTIYTVFNAIRHGLSDEEFNQLFEHGQFVSPQETANKVKEILQELENLYEIAKNDGDYRKVLELMENQNNDWPSNANLTNERHLISILKQLVYASTFTENYFRANNNYGVFKKEVYDILDRVITESNIVIYDGASIYRDSGTELKPVKILNDSNKYRGSARPTVCTIEIPGFKLGDAIFDENADDRWNMNGKISTSTHQTKENDASLGAFLNHVIRNSLKEDRRGNIYQKHNDDWKYYQNAKADGQAVNIQREEVLLDNVILDTFGVTSEELGQITDENLTPNEQKVKYLEYVQKKAFDAKSPQTIIFNNRGQYSIINIDAKFPGLSLNKLPFDVVMDSEGKGLVKLELSDGSTQLYDTDSDTFTELIARPRTVLFVNPENAEIPYIIGTDLETVESEIKIANVLLFKATSRNKREALNLTGENIDQAIGAYLDERIINSPFKLRWLDCLNSELQKPELLTRNYDGLVITAQDVRNVSKMIEKINRYLDDGNNEGWSSCSKR